MTLSEYLMRMRLQKGITKDALSKKLGVSPAVVSGWESDRSLPNFRSIKALCNYYKISADEIISKEEY